MWERNLGQNFWGPYPWGLISESFHEWYEKGQSTGDWCINKSYGIRASSIIIMALQRSYTTMQFKWCLTSSDFFYSYKTCFTGAHFGNSPLQSVGRKVEVNPNNTIAWKWKVYMKSNSIYLFFPSKGRSKISWVNFLFMLLKYILCLLS